MMSLKSDSGLGTISHEFGHFAGMADKYDSVYDPVSGERVLHDAKAGLEWQFDG